jgi:hypothetical protein
MIKIYVDEVPDTKTIDSYITEKTKSDEKWYMVSREFRSTSLEFKIKDYDPIRLANDSLEALDTFGFSGWQTKESTITRYGGLSFAANPNHKDNKDTKSSTLGTVSMDAKDFYDPATTTEKILKNTYFDTYSFTQPTELTNFKYIKEFLQGRAKRTLIRSRLAVMKAGDWTPDMTKFAWHRDEPVYLNLRINIPIITSPEYMFQIENKEPVHLEVGNAYTWNTRQPHCVFQTDTTTTDRIHFVLGYSPWFDYDAENRCWIQNDFWGKHPFQMLIDGDVFGGLDFLAKF